MYPIDAARRPLGSRGCVAQWSHCSWSSLTAAFAAVETLRDSRSLIQWMDADLEGAVVSWLRGASVGELRTFLLYCGVDGGGLPAGELYAVVESACVDCPGFVGSAFLRYRDPATGVPR